ncbi:MAG: hypothetical protein F6J93_01480 [Oscillatoria sp. SIO1A7]|nr:hypothetical protein [Oscillatoria sp. SIO1A7]
MNQNANLKEQLAALQERMPGLGSRLAQAAIELKEAGVPPAEILLEQLRAYRQDFASLRELAIASAKSLPNAPLPSQVLSLKDIERLLSSPGASAPVDKNREAALQVLDRVLAIFHAEQKEFPPLQAAQSLAGQLRQKIAQASPDSFPEEVAALATGRHAFCGLLNLIDPPVELDDDRWEKLVEGVTRAFNKSLTVAAARGKLVLREPAAGGAIAAPIAEYPGTQEIPEVLDAGTQSRQDFPEVVVISASGNAPPTPAESQADREILRPPSPKAKDRDVIILPSYDEPEKPVSGSKRLVFGSVPLSSQGTSSQTGAVGLQVMVHIERIGDRSFGQNEFAGTRGQALRIEALAINIEPPIPGLSLRYMAHIEGSGDTPWVTEGEWIGSRESGKRLEGFAIELTGESRTKYDLFYTAHVQNVGDVPPTSNGDFCGTRGSGLRIEGIRVWVQEK